MSKLLSIWEFICKHKIPVAVITLVILIGFVDENSVVKYLAQKQEISELNKEIEKYRNEYEESTQKLNELTTNPDALERVAREKYLMKKPNEDIYVFE